MASIQVSSASAPPTQPQRRRANSSDDERSLDDELDGEEGYAELKLNDGDGHKLTRMPRDVASHASGNSVHSDFHSSLVGFDVSCCLSLPSGKHSLRSREMPPARYSVQFDICRPERLSLPFPTTTVFPGAATEAHIAVPTKRTNSARVQPFRLTSIAGMSAASPRAPRRGEARLEVATSVLISVARVGW